MDKRSSPTFLRLIKIILLGIRLHIMRSDLKHFEKQITSPSVTRNSRVFLAEALTIQSSRQWAVVSLVCARVVYAINWLNIGALFYLMSSDLGTGVSGLGTLTSSFYIGVGLMQIPGGILAAIWGPRRTVTLGVFVSSIAVLATSMSTSLIEAGIFRFIVGSGMALVFSPMVVLAAKLLGGRSGVGAGLVNSAFGLGGMLGLFGWVLIATATGWRPSLVLSGTLGLLSGVMTVVMVPKDERRDGFRLSWEKLGAVVRQRNLAVLGLGALGANLGSVLISSFMVYYLQTSLGESGAVAGLIAAMVVFLPILSSLWGGQIYDRMKRPRRILVAAGFGMVAALIVCSVHTLWAASLGAVIGGAAVGPASTVAFAAARDLSHVEKEYESLTIGWVNCISLTGSVWPPLIFSYLAGSSGYTAAWLVGSGLSLILLIPLLFLLERDTGVQIGTA